MRVLLVDDDRTVLRAMERPVQRMRPDCTITSLWDGRAAMAALDADPFDLVLTDIRMPGVSDDALAARLLQVANSAFSGAAYRPTNVFDAVIRVGSNTLQCLALSLGAFRAFSSTDRCAGFQIEAHEAHSFLVARIAARLVRNAESEDAFAMALLHDIGKLVFASRMSREFAPLLAKAAAEGKPLLTVERETGFTPHAVHVADALVHELSAERGVIPASAVPPLDRAMLSTLGVEEFLDEWREIAVEETDCPPEEE